MRWIGKLVLLLVGVVFVWVGQVRADTKETVLERIGQEIERYQTRLGELREARVDLESELEVVETRIRLAELERERSELQASLLGGRAEQLRGEVVRVAERLKRIKRELVKVVMTGEAAVLEGDGTGEGRLAGWYLGWLAERQVELLERLGRASGSYEQQRGQVAGVVTSTGVIDRILLEQKAARENLLRLTENDERKFERLLAQARAEFGAIEGIVAGRGVESLVGQVAEGEVIARVIEGQSCNSSGTHLHFIVSQGGEPRDPFSYLSPVEHRNCSGPGVCSAADSFEPRGEWRWPIEPVVEMAQGFGETWAVRNTFVGRIYRFHNGIDVRSTSGDSVRAVADGQLYRGSFAGERGCSLDYVRVDHSASDLETLYLHAR